MPGTVSEARDTAAAKLVVSASISRQRKYSKASRLGLDTEQDEQEPHHQLRLGALDRGELVSASCSSLSYESSPHICRLLCRHRAFW